MGNPLLYLVLLIIGSGAAIAKDRWLLAVVLWINFGGTVSLADEPMAVGVLDLACAAVLVRFGSKRDYVVAALFAVMVAFYAMAGVLGKTAIYSIVDGLAYAQIFVIGSGGFGKLFTSLRRSVLAMLVPTFGGIVGFGGHSDIRPQDDMGGNKKRGDAG